MARYFLTFSYDGTAYHGWQVQPNADSVQQQLNRALSVLLQSEVSTVGAGRTDTGVHASMMVAHFDAEIDDEARFCFKLNRLLPPDIAVQSIRRVRPDAHARFDALSRTYHYFVYTGKRPFLRHYANQLFFEPDYERMNRAAELLLRTTDFTSFSKLHTDTKTNNCRVTKACWPPVADGSWRFEITADRFLRNMVRAVVGTLLWVGQGRMSLDDFQRVIDCRNRCAAGDSVAARALFLVDITYPDDVYLKV